MSTNILTKEKLNEFVAAPPKAELAVLMAIHKHPDCYSGELTRWVDYSIGSIYRYLDRLKKRGLIYIHSREPSPINKVKRAYLRTTEAGSEVAWLIRKGYQTKQVKINVLIKKEKQI